jgi:hypothetical protein
MAGFFKRLAAARKEESSHLLKSFVDRWRTFEPRFRAILTLAAEHERVSAPAYNIFRVPRVEHDEENTHSRFLADLLNPHGSHGQGHLFLQAFLNRCHEKQGLLGLADEAYGLPWFIDTEVDTQQGRVDLVITCQRAGYLAAVENKIFAAEQERQIIRYHEWLESRSHTYARRCLIFLTPDGRQPVTAGGCQCVALSYRRDVSQILRATLSKLTAANLRAVIAQYLDVIENLISGREEDREPGQVDR